MPRSRLQWKQYRGASGVFSSNWTLFWCRAPLCRVKVFKTYNKGVTHRQYNLEQSLQKVFKSDMPDQRDKNKKFIGSWLPLGLAAGIETWLRRHPKKDRTDFLIEASLSRLEQDGIIVSMPEEVSKGRPRKEIPKSAYDLVREEPAPYQIKKKPR